MPQPSWEAVLNKDALSAPGTVPQAWDDDDTDYPRGILEDHLEERRIGKNFKVAVKQLVTDELVTLLNQSLDDILCLFIITPKMEFARSYITS